MVAQKKGFKLMQNEQSAVTFDVIFQELCRLNDAKITPTLNKLDISTSALGNWKLGGRPQKATIQKIEKYFEIEDGALSNLLMGLESPYSKKQYEENWQIILRSMFPNSKPLPGVDDLAVLTQDDLNALKEYIQSIRENLIRIERLVYGENKKDRH